jgi:hypothetical protein
MRLPGGPQAAAAAWRVQSTNNDSTRQSGIDMWNLISCYLSGRHDYQVRCEPGAIFLTCNHCGKRSMGWELRAQAQIEVRVPVTSGQHVVTHAHGR